MNVSIVELKSVVNWFISVNHLSNANVIVISHNWFSISLLGYGSPYMGHHFQVQVICNLQGRSLGGLGLIVLFVVLFWYYMQIQANGLKCI